MALFDPDFEGGTRPSGRSSIAADIDSTAQDADGGLREERADGSDRDVPQYVLESVSDD
jgi:hypothetical protein